MKKKLLALLLSGAMILSLTTPVALAEEPEGECCGSCGQVECVCPPEEAPCEVCGEIECVCEKAEELPEEEVPGAAAPEIPEEPTACEICGEIECECEKIEEPEVPEVPEEPTACEVCGEIECICEKIEEPEVPEVPEIPEEPTACEKCGEIECICEGVNDYAELYEALMACETTEDAMALLDELNEDEEQAFLEWLNDEEYAALEAHLNDIYEPWIPMEVVSVSEVAPFLPPVEATVSPRLMRNAFRTMALAAEEPEEENGLILSKIVEPGANDTEFKITLEAFVTGAVSVSSTETMKPADIVLVLDVSGSMVNESNGESQYITVGSKNDTSELDTTYGAAEGIYQYSANGYNSWRSMRYNNGKWQYTSNGRNWTDLADLADSWSSGSIRINKMNALKIAVQNFIDQVNAKTVDDKGNRVDHRIAIVKFAGTKTDEIGNDVYNGGTYNYTQIVQGLTSVNTGASSLKSTVVGLSAGGATSADWGMEHAQTLINGIESTRSSSRVVVMFTDGQPNHPGDGGAFKSNVANAAIAASKTIKEAGTTVYTIGVFSEANDSRVTNSTSNFNKYMHYVSSNFKNATSMTDPKTATYPAKADDSYYLAADNATKLNMIFETITSNIQNGSASMELGSTTVVKDIVSTYFKLPENTSDVSVKTYDCLSYDEDTGAATWSSMGTTLNNAVTIDTATKSVNVTGFDFTHNFVAETPRKEGDSSQTGTFRGRKLAITFTVEPEAGFLGGNNVPTNGTDSAVYKASGEKIEAFVVPTVNVPIPAIAVDVVNKNTYLNGSVSADELISGATATAFNGSVDLLSGNLDWRDDFVNISDVLDKDGANNLTDTDYTYTVTVSPKVTTSSNAMDPVGAKYGSDSANIFVYEPYATFKDSTIYQDATPKYSDNGPTSLSWRRLNAEKNEYIAAKDMVGTAPNVSYTYSPGAGTAFDECTPVQPTIHLKNEVTGNSITGGKADAFTVHVLKPSVVVNLADTSAYYGDTYDPAKYTGGSAVVSWSDTHTGIPEVAEGTEAPFGNSDVTLQYYGSAAVDATVKGAFTMTKQPAKVYVKAFHGADQLTVTGYNTTCNVSGHNCATHTNGYYTVHPLTCQLTITKTGGAAGEPYVFDIEKKNADGKWEKYSEATIVGNDSETIYELPVGEYKVVEEKGWSWRYDATYSDNVTLTSGNTSGEIICTNTANSLIYWLNGFSQVVKNIFGKIIQN